MKYKCMVALREGGPMIVEAYFIQAVPKLSENGISRAINKDTMDFTVDALVELNTFDKGAFYQVPFNRIKMVDEWETTA